MYAKKRPYFKDKGVNVEHLIYDNIEIEDNDYKQFVDTMPIMAHFYDEYGLHHTKTIVSVMVVLTFFVVWLYCYAKAMQFEHYENYIYNRIKKIKRKQDRKYRKWLM